MQPLLPQPQPLILVDGICFARPQGESSLPSAVELVKDAIVYCRQLEVPTLLFNATGLTGVSIPNLVDRFLMVEDWASAARQMVMVALVVQPEYIHPEKFGVVLARDLGLTCDVFTAESNALRWLSGRNPDLT